MARRRAGTICLPFGAVRGVARYRPRDPSIRAVPHSRPTGWSVFRWDVLDGVRRRCSGVDGMQAGASTPPRLGGCWPPGRGSDGWRGPLSRISPNDRTGHRATYTDTPRRSTPLATDIPVGHSHVKALHLELGKILSMSISRRGRTAVPILTQQTSVALNGNRRSRFAWTGRIFVAQRGRPGDQGRSSSAVATARAYLPRARCALPTDG
jgi:hypothetical protein